MTVSPLVITIRLPWWASLYTSAAIAAARTAQLVGIELDESHTRALGEHVARVVLRGVKISTEGR